nr:hypothetical protein [Actinomyces marmotae]
MLFMSEGTVRNHVSAALARTGLRNRTQLAVLYLRAPKRTWKPLTLTTDEVEE